MELTRRRFLHLAARAAALPVFLQSLLALDYPTRPIRLIVGFPPGGTTDIVARTIAQLLSAQLGQPIVVDNRPSGATNLAVQAALGAPPDGYTLLFSSSSNAINATFYYKLLFNLLRDLAPVAGVARSPFFMEVHPSVPAKTVAEFMLTTYRIRSARQPWANS